MSESPFKLEWTQMPNIIFDEIMSELTGSEYKILTAICRKTYGWHKDKDKISNFQFEEMTGCSPDTISTAIKSLKVKNLILTSSQIGYPNTFEINEDWHPPVKLPPLKNQGSQADTPPKKSGDYPPVKLPPTKETLLNKEKEEKIKKLIDLPKDVNQCDVQSHKKPRSEKQKKWDVYYDDVIKVFLNEYEKKFGIPYEIGGADRKAAERIWNKYKKMPENVKRDFGRPDEMTYCIAKYFFKDEKMNGKYTIPLLDYNFNGLIQKIMTLMEGR